MSWRSGLTSPGSRTKVVGGLLVLTLALAGVLAYQVVDANRSHERVARKTVGEQAAVAAWAYTQAARSLLSDKLFLPACEVVSHAGGSVAGEPLDPAVWESKVAEKKWDYADGVTGIFRVNLGSGDVTTLGDLGSMEEWIGTSLVTHAAAQPGTKFRPIARFREGSPDPVVYVNESPGDGSPDLVYGLIIQADAFNSPLNYAFTNYPLLPPTLTGEYENQDLFSVRVTTPEGAVLYQDGPMGESEFTAKDTLGMAYGGLITEVQVKPELAEMLVVGGFPRSRMPQVMGLLALGSLLVVAAIFQLKREGELAQLRADFVSGVSHELRTPLAQIRMFSETLLLGRVRSDEERHRSLEIIVNESQRLSHQLDNVLLFSRGERGTLQLIPAPTDLGALLTEILEAFRPLAEAAGVHVELESASDVVGLVDPIGMRQAVLNLLDNAVKYGPPGQTIRVGVSRLPARRILLWVEDEGPGVPPEDRGSIFEPYYRLEDHRESAVAGSGIGLAVVRRIAEQHGGSVNVEAANGKGARFVLDLPAATATRGEAV